MDDSKLSDQEFRDLRKLVFELAGITMGENKRHLLKSRLQRRLRDLGLKTFTAYIQKLQHSHARDPEREAFINAVTTNKTDFFRESHHFEFVVNRIVPELLRSGKTELRIWHAGCSTGEEPYTMAMTLLEKKWPAGFRFRQFATDIDTSVLAHAQAGIYAEERLDTVPRHLIQKWFLRGKGDQKGFFRVSPDLQENVVFRQINLVQKPWAMKDSTRFDIIFCRNVLIYFSRETQAMLVSNLVERLHPGGYLLLGHSESLHTRSEALEGVGPTIYRKACEHVPMKGAA